MQGKYIKQSDYSIVRKGFLSKRILIISISILLILFFALEIYWDLEDSGKSLVTVVLKSFTKHILLGGLFLLYFYKQKEDKPSTWINDLEIDFDKREMKINSDNYSFDAIYHIKAKEIDLSIIPNYYKIWAVLDNGEKVKVLALKDVSEYSFLVKKFHEAGIPVN